MQFVTKLESITHKILNEATGELESKDFKEIRKHRRVKGGFNFMYHKDYEAVTETVVKSNKDLKLFNWITNKFAKTKVEVQIVHSTCDLDISQPVFSKMIKKLIEIKYLKRVGRGIYRLNPFIYVPYQGDVETLQREWNELEKP
jgi:hypothetical protein